MQSVLPFLLFALVAAITPGPTNIIVLSQSARFGLLRALPLVLGGCGGAALLVLIVGLGLADSLLRYPRVQVALAWAGVLWLTWLAWRIFRAPPVAISADAPATGRVGLLGIAGLQWINPKTWMMALAVIGVFGGDQGHGRVVLLATLFFLVSLPCLLLWAYLGRGAQRLMRSPAAMQRFNRLMAALLLVSAWASLL